jgi:hypothetical protein
MTTSVSSKSIHAGLVGAKLNSFLSAARRNDFVARVFQNAGVRPRTLSGTGRLGAPKTPLISKIACAVRIC